MVYHKIHRIMKDFKKWLTFKKKFWNKRKGVKAIPISQFSMLIRCLRRIKRIKQWSTLQMSMAKSFAFRLNSMMNHLCLVLWTENCWMNWQPIFKWWNSLLKLIFKCLLITKAYSTGKKAFIQTINMQIRLRWL